MGIDFSDLIARAVGCTILFGAILLLVIGFGAGFLGATATFGCGQ